MRSFARPSGALWCDCNRGKSHCGPQPRQRRHNRPPEENTPSVRLWDGRPLQGDDYKLDYDADGYPELPDCLRRR